MSHVTTIQLSITDLDALEAACRRCDLVLLRDQKEHQSYSGKLPCDHAIAMPGQHGRHTYEAGVVKNADSPGYHLEFDFFGQMEMKERVGGRQFERLTQLYGVEKATREARRQGFQVQEKALASGEVKLQLTRF